MSSRASRRSSRGDRRSLDDDIDDASDMDDRKLPARQLATNSSDEGEEAVVIDEGDDEMLEDGTEVQFTQQAPEASQPMFPVKESERIKLDRMARDAKEKIVTDLSRLLLFKGLAGEPIDKRKCAKEALGDYSNDRITASAFEEAAVRLKDVFGFELRRPPEFMEKREDFPKKYKERLFLINGLEDEEGGTHSKAIHSVHPEHSMAKGLLMVVLAFAFCKGAQRGGARWISDKDLYRLLHGLDENIPEEPPAPTSRKQKRTSRHAGDSQVPDVDALLEKFVHQDYLLKDKATDDAVTQPTQSDDCGFIYSMGPRAAMEIGRKQVVSFCAEILDEEPDPSMLAEIEGDDEGELMDQ